MFVARARRVMVVAVAGLLVLAFAPSAAAQVADEGPPPSGAPDQSEEPPPPSDGGDVEAPTPDEGTLPAAVGRISGADRYETAAVLGTIYPSGGTVFVASGEGYADALAGGPVAAVEDAPILLVSRTRVPAATSEALDILQPTQIVLLGGTGAVAPEVEADLDGWAPVERVAGADRYATAAALAERGFPNGARGAIVATGREFADALSGASRGAAFSDPMPVLLVERDVVPDSTWSALQQVAPEVIAVLGGTQSVSSDVEDELAQLADVERFGGASRYETSALVAGLYDGPSTQVVFVSTGTSFPDALAAAPVVGFFDGPTLLVPASGAVPEMTKDALRAFTEVQYVVVVGGSGAVADEVIEQIADVVNTETGRW